MDEHGLRQSEVAQTLRVSPAQVSAVARGVQRPSRDFMAALIRSYELPGEEWWSAAGYNATTQEPLDERQKVAEMAVRMALSYDARRFERELLETVAEYYAEPPFLAVHNHDLAALLPDAARETVIRRVQIIEARLRERRRAVGGALPPPLFVTGE